MSKTIKDISPKSQFDLRDYATFDDNQSSKRLHISNPGMYISGIIGQNGKKLSEMYDTKNVLYIKHLSD